MDFMRNLKGKGWWIDGFRDSGRTLKRGTREGENWGKNEDGLKTPIFNHIVGAWAVISKCLGTQPLEAQFLSVQPVPRHRKLTPKGWHLFFFLKVN